MGIITNVHNGTDFEQYKKGMFSDNGWNMLNTYVCELIKVYLKHEQVYPWRQGIFLGIPQMLVVQDIESKEMLLERIKAYAMILGKTEFQVNMGDSSVATFKLEVKNHDE